MFTHLNIFSGAGGFELAAEQVGWVNIASCEINRYARTLLQLRFPGTTVHTDARTTDFRLYRDAVDVLTMSPPCQGHSLMGKRLSRSDDRDMLAICARALDEIRPRVAILENVPGLLSSESGLAIRDICQAMERTAGGYTILPLLIPAGGAGALHLRYRIWLVAHTNAKRRQSGGFSTVASAQENRHSRYHHIDAHAERRRAAGKAGILGIYDALPPALDGRPGQKLRLMGNAVVPSVVIPIFQAIDAALRVE